MRPITSNAILWKGVPANFCISGALPLPGPLLLMAHDQQHFTQDSILSLIRGQQNLRPILDFICVIPG